MPKVIIEVSGGLVTTVKTSTDDVEVLVMDTDFEGADEDELMSQKELNEFRGGKKFKGIDFKSGIVDSKEVR